LTTQFDAYARKSSSGLLLALLAFSSIVFLVPFAAPVHAATQVSPTLTVYPSIMGGQVGGYDNYFELKVTNPANNPYAITEIVITLPAGWAFDTGTPTGGSYLTSCTSLGTMQSADCTGSGLAPGISDTLDLSDAVAPEVSAPTTVNIGVTVKDSSGVFNPAPSIQVKVFPADYDGSASSQGAGATTYSAGSGTITFSSVWTYGSAADGSAIHPMVGVPIYFNFFDTQYDPTTVDTSYAGSFTPSSAVVNTNSTGVAAIKVQPSNTKGDVIFVDSNLGTWDTNTPSTINTYCDWDCWDSGLITTTNGAPTTVGFSTPSVTHYVSTFGTPTWTGATGNWAKIASAGLVGQVKDSFGNSITSGITSEACTITGFGGSFDNAGTQSSTNSIAAGASCSTAGAIASTLNYFQSGAYGTTTYVQGTMTGTYNSASFTAQGLSKNLITSTFDSGTSATPASSPALAGNVAAGKSVKLTYQLTHVQSGVPITFLGLNSTSPYLGSFVGGYAPTDTNPANVTIVTDGTGKAVATFNVDTTEGSAITFEANVAAPIDGTPSHMLGVSAPTGAATTIAGTATGLLVQTAFDSIGSQLTSAALGGTAQTLYIDVSLVDAYGNFATNPSASQIGIAITVSSGAVTAPTTFIAFGESDTYDSFGVISWSFNGAIGTNITITATGTLPGATSPSTNTEKVSLVSPNPILKITSPTGTTVYSKFPGVAFSGKVTLSKGYAPGAVTIAGIFFKIDNGAWSLIGSTSPFTTAPSFTNGLHTISFFTNDSLKDSSTTTVLQVLVDTAGPSIAFTTPANANLTGGTAVAATITDPQGDLNATAVTATGNSTTKLSVSVTGANNLGHSVTYTVSISGLTVGTWTVALNAADLAGNTVTKSLVVHVTVPFAQSFVVSGTPSKGTLGGFTGINVAYSNLNPTSQSVVIFAVWKNSLSQTVGIGTSSATVGAGASTSAFIVEPVGLPSGTYSVNIFVFTTSNSPVSVTTTISVTV